MRTSSKAYQFKLTEALRRMRILGISEEEIERFVNDNTVPASYEMDDMDLKIMSAVQAKYDVVIYYAMLSLYPEGLVWHFLGVSRFTEDWKNERMNLENGKIALTYNYSPKAIWFEEDHMLIDFIPIDNYNGFIVHSLAGL